MLKIVNGGKVFIQNICFKTYTNYENSQELNIYILQSRRSKSVIKLKKIAFAAHKANRVYMSSPLKKKKKRKRDIRNSKLSFNGWCGI